jgi:putative lipoic acid-binding regulatory protein
MALKGKEEQLEYPVDAHFKIITEDIEHMDFVIESVLMQLGIDAPVRAGNRSANNRYITYNVSIRVESRDMMYSIDSQLRDIEGVKVVL